MMSIILKGIDKSKYARTFRIYPSGKVLELNDEGLLDNENPYQAIQIPTPHGRLIDGDKLLGEFIDWQYTEAPDHLNTKEGKMVTDHERQYELYLALGEAVIEIANAPTILESED